MATVPPAERRRFPRLACRAAVQYRDILKPREPQAGGLSKDLSAGGLQFETAQFFAHRSRVLLQVTLPGLVAPLRTIAQVTWSRKQPLGERFDVGVRFVEITPTDRGLVADYVERGIMQPR